MTSKYAKVDWLDACSDTDYYKHEKKLGVMHVSVGHLIRNDKQGVVLALTHVPYNKDHRMYLEIPRAYVKKVTRLR